MNAVKVQILWECPKNLKKKSLLSFWNLVVTSTKRDIFKKFLAFSEYLNFNHNDPLGFLRHAKGTEKDFDSICLHAPKDTWVVNTGGKILQQNCAVVQAKHNDRSCLKSITCSWHKKPRIHKFINLKCCKISFQTFKVKEQGK